MNERIYIAGPVTGIKNYNYPAFEAAEALFKKQGWEVSNPTLIADNKYGGDKTLHPSVYMRHSIEMLLGCQAIAMLYNWHHSRGAKAEAAVALILGMSFYDAQTGEKINRPHDVWVTGYD